MTLSPREGIVRGPYDISNMAACIHLHPQNDIVTAEGSLYKEKCYARFNSFVFDDYHSWNWVHQGY